MTKRMVVAIAVALAAFGASAAPATAAPPEDWFRPGAPFDHEFADPSVTPVGPYTIAYSTGQGGAHLPAMWTTDHATWTARAEEPDSSDPCYDRYENDAWENPGVGMIVQTPTIDNGCMEREVWAPSVAFIGNKWSAYAAVRVSGNRFCIYRAHSDSALGPFTTSSTSPFVCDADPNGSIDPDVYVDLAGNAYLMWKSEGVPGSAPTRIWSRKLNGDGSAFAPGSKRRMLLETTANWEMSNPSTGAGLVENPSMVLFQGKHYLFYSGNEFRTSAYGQGYATCSGPLGPCTKKTTSGPVSGLSATGRWGAGGGDAFVDDRGRLMLQYHAWDRSGGQAAGGIREPHTAQFAPSGSGLRLVRADDNRGAGPDYRWDYRKGAYSSSRQVIGGVYTTVAGRFSSDRADDVYFVGTADRSDRLWKYSVGGAKSSVAAPRDGSYVPLVGDFDGDSADVDDIYWYSPLGDPEHPTTAYGDEFWIHDRSGGHRVIDSSAVKQDGFALPLTGDFDGDGKDQIFWYVPGGTSDVMWELSGDTPTKRSYTVNGFYQYPQVGDFDGNGTDDILWYAPGTRSDYVWFFRADGTYRSEPRTANGVYVPMTGDFDGNGVDDIVWYGPGSSADYEWNFRSGGSYASRPRQVNGYYTTTVGDFDGNGHDDILWYS
ncbi:family 43 glycosylhydrolase [Actinospongicola halichondriae]|uniref:family 43 glycosylhydrolase n=1 Tax=Actinospongicola halichondriae TaxID=3236844 RepID=UPI003D524834